MSENESPTRAGRWIALLTAVVTLAGAAVSAGLIKANAENASGSPGKGQEVVTPIPAPSTPAPAPKSAPPPSSTSTYGASWRSDAAGLCSTAQEYLDDHAEELVAWTTWEQLSFFGEAVKVLDSHLKQVEAPPDVQPRIQLMVQNWDSAADALIRAGDDADREDYEQARVDQQAYEGPNGRGNQIADDLGLTVCADLALR
jgi:hypothetical protein